MDSTPDNSEKIETNTTSLNWDEALEAGVCERCDWNYLLPIENPSPHCPHCFEGKLTQLGKYTDAFPDIRPPELILLPRLKREELSNSIVGFARGIPFTPQDLNPENLVSRLQCLYLPSWLVDAEVNATWQMEAGFDYEVVSHQDHFEENLGGWKSRQVTEGRIRWEPRVGMLRRSYQNISSPALEEDRWIKSGLGGFQTNSVSPYQADLTSNAYVRLPDRDTQDAWSDAKPAFQAVAAEECRQAARADHIRQFSWQPEFENLNWTLLLQPIYTTFYLDDNKRPRSLLINAQNGRLIGKQRASMKRAQRSSLIILIVAIMVFLLSMLVSAAAIILPILLAIGVIGIVLAILISLGAIYPIATVWWFNRNRSEN